MPGPLLPRKLEQLLSARWEARIVPGLERIRRALGFLGHPEKRFPSVLVLGTNGKGSTCAFLASLLQQLGLRVGLYTSPHLVSVGERIQLNGKPLGPEELLPWVQRLAQLPELSYFETLTAVAFAVFADNHVDLAVVEAGLGGRWDATNAKDHELVLLTNVGTDHQHWLGPTREHIAAEKAAAIRGREGILGQVDEAILPVIRAHADPNAPLSHACSWARVHALDHEPGLFPQVEVETCGLRYSATLPLAGPFQARNYELALAGLAALASHRLVPKPTLAALLAGTRQTRWPGRMELVRLGPNTLLLDGAHNLEAVEALVAGLRRAQLAGQLDLIFSCLSDKPLLPMAQLLQPCARQVTVVSLDSPRALPLPQLAAAFPGCRQATNVRAALAAADPQVITLVTGSLRLVGEVKTHLAEGQ